MIGMLFGAVLATATPIPECDPSRLAYRSIIEPGDDFIRVTLVISPENFPAHPCSLTFASKQQVKYELTGSSGHWVGYLYDINDGPAKLILDVPYTLVTIKDVPRRSVHGTYTLQTTILTASSYTPPSITSRI